MLNAEMEFQPISAFLPHSLHAAVSFISEEAAPAASRY